MTNQFTEVTNRGFFSRIMGSFAGLIGGPLIFIGAIVLLSWNEGRAVQAIRGLNEASKVAVEGNVGAVAAANEGKLVHLVGPATASAPIADPDVEVSFPGQVVVARDVQMYQWREKSESKTREKLGGGQETTTTYTYEREWSSQAIDSSDFKHPDGHANPAMPFSATHLNAGDAKLGAFTLDASTLGLFSPQTPLTPTAPKGWRVEEGHLAKGEADAPKVGDLRVAYTGLPSGTTVSILAAQSQQGFAPFTTSNGFQLEVGRIGNHPLSEMIAQERKANATLTWILRGVGFVGLFIGVTWFLGPLSTFASVIPFLAGIVRGAAGLLGLVIAAPVGLTVIALSWIAFRPLLGIGLLVLAAAALGGLAWWHRRRNPAPTKPAPTGTVI